MMGFRAEVGLGLRLYLAPTIAVALVALILLPILLLLVATIAGLTFVMSMLVDRLRARHSAPLPERCWNVPQVGALHLTTRDGVALRGYIARPSAPASRDKPHRIVLLCQPLGQCPHDASTIERTSGLAVKKLRTSFTIGAAAITVEPGPLTAPALLLPFFSNCDTRLR